MVRSMHCLLRNGVWFSLARTDGSQPPVVPDAGEFEACVHGHPQSCAQAHTQTQNFKKG